MGRRIFLLLLFLVALFFMNFLLPRKSALVVLSDPPSTIFINGKHFGKTPLVEIFEPGDVFVMLQPDGLGKSFETRVSLNPGVKTVVQRHFDKDGKSAGLLLTLEKSGSDKPLANIVSAPENAQVLIDDQLRGFTPLFLEGVAPGKHTITLMHPDFFSKTVSVRFYEGYRLEAFFDLLPSKDL